MTLYHPSDLATLGHLPVPGRLWIWLVYRCFYFIGLLLYAESRRDFFYSPYVI